jgi:hypothetical protein
VAVQLEPGRSPPDSGWSRCAAASSGCHGHSSGHPAANHLPPGALTLAGLITLFQRGSEDSYRGRVFGALSALEGVSVLAGTLGAGYLSRVAGIVPVLAVQGAGYVVAGLFMFRGLRNSGEGVSLAPGKPVAACPGTA